MNVVQLATWQRNKPLKNNWKAEICGGGDDDDDDDDDDNKVHSVS